MTQEDKISSLMDVGLSTESDSIGKSVELMMGCDGEQGLPCEVSDFTLPRKASKELLQYPYRKPTQVGEERILRPSEESLLRNSAN